MADDKKKQAKDGAKAGGAAKGGAAKPGKPGKPGKDKAARPSGPVTVERPHSSGVKPGIAKHYEDKVRPELMKKFGYASVMQAPRFEKIVLNMGVGDATQDQKLLDAAMNELGQITGQRPALRRAKKSISNFKLREGVGVGCSVTLRGARMYEFYERLVSVAVPRIRGTAVWMSRS